MTIMICYLKVWLRDGDEADPKHCRHRPGRLIKTSDQVLLEKTIFYELCCYEICMNKNVYINLISNLIWMYHLYNAFPCCLRLKPQDYVLFCTLHAQ